MVNHFSPGETVQLIYVTASCFGLVLLGPELPAMLTDPRQLTSLPDDLASAEPAPVLVASGNEIQGLIESDDETYRHAVGGSRRPPTAEEDAPRLALADGPR